MNERNIPTTIISSVVLLWLAFCCVTFLVLHWPMWYVVFQYLPAALGKLNLRFPDMFWVDVICAIAMLAVNGIVGMLFLRLFIRMPALLEIAANVFMGIGISHFLLMFPAIFFLLSPFSIGICYAVIIGLLLGARYMWGWAEVRFETGADDQESLLHKTLFYSAFAVVGIITLLTFYHAVLFPVNYWDSLIYYIHYGKMTYEEGGFPILYCLQVGLGLGANYPHLFNLNQAVTATVFFHWSDLYGQLLCPVAGLGACIVIYYLCRHLFAGRLTAMLAVLVFRTIPYVNSYIIWASDYALVIMYTCLLMLFLRMFLLNPSYRMLMPLLCTTAIFPNINYLGWIVWPVAGMAVLIHYKEFLVRPQRLGITLLIFLLWLLPASVWYARNYMVTGNPVYAFFPEILGGENINLDVLRSSEQEWKYHGWGAAHLPGETVWYRLLNTPVALLQMWHFAPVVLGIMLPSLLLGWRRYWQYFLLVGVLIGLYGFYEYFISGFYWYHIIAVFPMLAVFTARFLDQVKATFLYPAFAVVLLIAGIAPGISVTVMGPKHTTPTLEHFAHPGLSPKQFYRYCYPQYASSWEYLNEHAEEGAAILTHDNRYHVFRDDLSVIHLDDCDLTPYYDRPYEEVHQVLWERGIRYYLFIQDELSHPITQRLGHQPYLDDERYYNLLHQTRSGGDVAAAVYKLVKPGEGNV